MLKSLLSKKKQIKELYNILSDHKTELEQAYKTIAKLEKEVRKTAKKTTTTKKASK